MSANTSVYPCDRGMQYGPRGLHDYVTYPGSLPTCRYCGQVRRPAFDHTPYTNWDRP